ncbi:Peptide transporter PTR3-A [Apostasia shenzhenica]|uniref:Peptide transporter PTR3-A n=1 Tax=Apostasia shenzhenica TaxID=1088818 RepID=A0A2I0AFC3_9ASPA|nr:Peptide transporter PTR3-A [Apostasia shenzhenica]
MMVAALTERMRLRAVRESGLIHAKTTVPLSVFVLVPQFALMGFAEMLVEVGRWSSSTTRRRRG